ncbi:MAG: hypothetical protein O3C40_24695 [Planctomycetota bacterium]|nr:hypothetical protein [Planctomycetota bacterium]
MLAEVRGGKEPPQHLLRDTINGWLNMFFGARVRFVLGACLTIGCLAWMQQRARRVRQWRLYWLLSAVSLGEATPNDLRMLIGTTDSSK